MAVVACLATVEPARAQTETEQTIWSGTMTVGKASSRTGYVSGTGGAGSLNPGYITENFLRRTITHLKAEDGALTFSLKTEPSLVQPLTQHWQLHVDDETYNFSEASYAFIGSTPTTPQNTEYWFTVGTSWSTAYSAGDTVQLRITRPLNTYPKHVRNARLRASGASSDRLVVTWDAPEHNPDGVKQYEMWYFGGTGAKGRNAVWRCVKDINDPTVITRPKDLVARTAPNASEACFNDQQAVLPNLEADTEYRVQIRARYTNGDIGPWTRMRARTGSGPNFQSARVPANGRSIELRFATNLDATAAGRPPTSAFQVYIDNVESNTVLGAIPVGVGEVRVSGRTVTLGNLSKVIRGDHSGLNRQVRVTYSDPSAGNDARAIQGTDGADVGTFTTGRGGVPATTNNSTVTAGSSGLGPEPKQIRVWSSGEGIDITWDEDIRTSSLPARSAFTITVDGSTVTGGEVTSRDSDKIQFRNWPITFRRTQSVTVSYTKPSSGNVVQDTAGNDAASFSNFPALNASTQNAPREPLTATFQEGPTRHTGEAFDIQLAFSGPMPVTAQDIQAGLTATGGEVTAVTRQADSGQLWGITLTPSNAGDSVTITLTPKASCEAENAICSADSRGLAEAITAEVPGREPTGVTSVSVTSEPGTNGTWDTGETVTAEVVFSRQVGVHGPPGVGPTLGILLGTTRREATWTGGAGTDTLTFSHTVGADDNGATSAAIITNGITSTGVTIGDTEGYEAILTFTGTEEPAPVEEPQEDPLTVQFVNVPASHDGDDEVVFEVHFSKNPSPYGWRKLRDHTLRVSQGGTRVVPRRAKRMQSGSNERWRITVEPTSKADMSISIEPTTDCSDTGAVCTADTPPQMLSVGASRVIGGPPSLSVADANATERTDATIDFTISLNRAASEAVSVQYATSDGTATAGADYVAATDTASIAAGETSTTVSIEILDDAIDEGEETFTLTLSNASGGDAWIADATATGTIENEGHMPSAWLSRFGRTVASQAVDAIGGRMQSDGTSHVTIAGHSFSNAGDEADEREEDAVRVLDPLAPDEAPGTVRTMSGQELLLGSSFQLSSGAEAGTAWTAWGEVATSGFEADVDGTRLDGTVTSAFLGADVGTARWLAGVAVSVSEGDGEYALIDNDAGGEVESSLTAVYPYGKLALSNTLDVWAFAGLGQGELTLAHMPEGAAKQVYRPDIDLKMGAIGTRGEVLSPTENGGLSIAIKSDAFWVRTSSDAVRGSDGNLEAAETDVSRVRLLVEGSRSYDTGGGRLTPTLEIGVRHDGGDAETGTGLEAGAGLQYIGDGVTIKGNVHTLIAHEESGYEEWGASGSVRVDPGTSGRGLSFSLAPSWGAAASGTDRLWSLRDASALSPDGKLEGEAESRLDAEVAYGLGLGHARGVVTPFAAMTLGDGRNVRTGARWQLSRDAALGIEARRETGYGDTPETGVRLEARVRF